MRVVSGSGIADGASAAAVQVAQVERELFYFVVRQVAAVADGVVARRASRALDGLVGHL